MITDLVSGPVPARRVCGFGASFWAGMGDLLRRHPDMIFFGGGVPARELIPVARLREASALAWEDAPEALEYGEVAGYRPLRELIAARLAERKGHFMPPALLESQFAALEPLGEDEPGGAVSIEFPPDGIVDRALALAQPCS